MDAEIYPVENGEPWAEGSHEWLARYEYIEARAEAFFDRYRDDAKYDFSKAGNGVTHQQKSVLLAYEKYAAGLLTVAGVKDQCKMLLTAFETPRVITNGMGRRIGGVSPWANYPTWPLKVSSLAIPGDVTRERK